MVDELYNFIHNYLFSNKSTLYFEYENSITVNAIIKSINIYDINYDIYIDYQFDTTNLGMYNQIFTMYLTVTTMSIIVSYEYILYWKSIYYKHELLIFYIKLYIFIVINLIDIVLFKYIAFNSIYSETNTLYQSIEYIQINEYFYSYLSTLLLFILFNITQLLMISNKNNNIKYLLLILIGYVFQEIELAIFLFFICKWIFLFEITIYLYIYNKKLDYELEKYNIGICIGTYNLK